jgi:uncharacterized protein
MKKTTLYVEVADTPTKQANGLMFRKELEPYSGMLFRFGNPKVLSFWGLNTYIPLDIAFISPENKIVKISRIKPFSKDGVCSDVDCTMAVEANDGFFASHGIKVGDVMRLSDDDNCDAVIFGNEKDIDEHEFTLKDIFS